MVPSVPPTRTPFLSARWCNLILANYPVPQSLLLPLVPPGCQLDEREGSFWVSLVGFQFLGTRVLGIGWPGFRNFPEWNLRFYVRHNGERGVCFVREFVPSWLVATTARVLYNEPYRPARMSMEVKESTDTVTASYSVKWQGRVNCLQAVGNRPTVRPVPESTEHWFKEHSWGFGTSPRGQIIRYQVNHPEWQVYPIREFKVDVDWASMYGLEWGVMTEVKPSSVVFAVGSEVSVFPKS
jgi:uncharacterized protein YqjF (DUF2071 family)